MKRSHEVPPMRVSAHLKHDYRGRPKLEWSRVEGMDETVDIGLPENRMSRLVVRVKHWIDTRIGAREDEIRMLRRLHRTDRLEIVVPDESGGPDRIEPYLKDYWRIRQTRHYRRMLVAGIAVLPALVLTVLPGPNVVGIPLAYLAWHHWRIVRGLNRVRSGDIHVELKSPPRMIRSSPADPSCTVSEATIDHETNQAADVQHS